MSWKVNWLYKDISLHLPWEPEAGVKESKICNNFKIGCVQYLLLLKAHEATPRTKNRFSVCLTHNNTWNNRSPRVISQMLFASELLLAVSALKWSFAGMQSASVDMCKRIESDKGGVYSTFRFRGKYWWRGVDWQYSFVNDCETDISIFLHRRQHSSTQWHREG